MNKTFSKFCNENSCKDCKYESSMGMTCEEMWLLEHDAEIRADERAKVIREVMPILLHIVNEEGTYYGFDEKICALEVEYNKILEI